MATHYCITLDRLPESLYPTIAANPLQWEQWEEQGMLDGKTDLLTLAEVGSVEYLKEHPYLMADTALFDASFKHALLADVDNLDDSLDGLLIHWDNFQALNLLQERYRKQVKCIYIDPPYNTGQDGFFYKDAFKSSSWITMIGDRISMSRELLADKGILFTSINEIERDGLVWQLRNAFGETNKVEELIWTQDTVSNNAPMYSTNHEYIEVFAKNRSIVERDPFLFRETRPGFKEVMEIVEELGNRKASIGEIEDAIKDLYKQHRYEHLEKAKTLGQTKEDAEKNDPWKGLYPYKNAEYRDINGKYIGSM